MSPPLPPLPSADKELQKVPPQPWRTSVCLPQCLGQPIVADLNCLTCPLSFVTQESSLVTTDQVEILWVQLPGQTHKAWATGECFMLPLSSSEKAQELCPGSQAVLSSLAW